MPGVDLLNFSDACQQLYAPGLDLKNYSARGFSFIRRLVPTEFIACGVRHPQTGRLTIGFDLLHSGFVTAMEAFGALMNRYQLYNWDTTINGGLPFRRSQFYSERQFRDLAIFQEVYRPLGIDNHCAFHVPDSPDKDVIFFGIERSRGPDFSDDELSLLALAQNQLANALHLARAHEAVADDRLSPALLAARAGLTPREAEVLHCLALGKSNTEIGLILRLRLPTVKGYVASIFDKLGVGNRLAAILAARDLCARDPQLPLDAVSGFVKVPIAPVPAP